ncbi:hypothetical protein OLK001_00730 [Synechocystis sp. LKSZ1]
MLGILLTTTALAQTSSGHLLPPPPPGPNPVPSPSAALNPVVNPASSPASYSQSQPNTPSVARSYRVLAVVQSINQEQQVFSLFPTAFRTHYQGQAMLQVGRFQDPTNAQQVSLQLQNLGVAAVIEP